ncbi:GNAT family N-acetyltransferase [Arenimonas daejeonensis]|uniref:GNAT family N-acetyltransferase n=1 Tax=Arenimonas daejeonensis TaxID=370777 RepID=UPI0011BF6EDE|nr:GNAT family N-acetyltransferase [Arenimonas daejeonensis]
MPPEYRLRTARATDLPGLLALEARFPGDRLSARQFRHHLGNPRARLRVAVAGGQVAGYHLVLLRAGSAWARLYSIAVDPAARGRGLGRRLLADAERQARVAGRRGLRFEVRQDNAAAVALYEAAGYRRQAALPAYYQDGGSGWRYARAWAAP